MSPGISEDVGKVASETVRGLPAPFLGLCVVNLFFVLGLLWFLRSASGDVALQNTQRMNAMEHVLTACLTHVPGAKPD